MQLIAPSPVRGALGRPVHIGHGAYAHHDRASWRQFCQDVAGDAGPSFPSHGDASGLAAADDIDQIYRPLAERIGMRAAIARRAGRGDAGTPRPFIVAIAGSVAVGKSRTARLLQALLKGLPDRPTVDLVATDGFIYPSAELARRGIAARKGFPESYDHRRLTEFLSDVRAGGCGSAPLYSHHAYDRIPGEHRVRNPDFLIIEGVNALQVEEGSLSAAHAGDPFALSIYLDADMDDIARWYEDRFLSRRNSAFRRPESPFHHLADASPEDVRIAARELWGRINAVNLVENILPTRSRADVILRKGPDHEVRGLLVRPLPGER